jgi:hypothetical protein
MNGDAFDAKHRHVCERVLPQLYKEHGHETFTIGQAQKWLNMALGERRLNGFAGLYSLGHVPIDEIMLRELVRRGAEALSCRRVWSRLDSYDEYFRLQCWVRDKYPETVPLAVEFHIFQSATRARGDAV